MPASHRRLAVNRRKGDIKRFLAIMVNDKLRLSQKICAPLCSQQKGHIRAQRHAALVCKQLVAAGQGKNPEEPFRKSEGDEILNDRLAIR